MPKGHKDLFEVNSRDDRAGFCELGDKAAHPCLPHLMDRTVLRRSGVVIASAKLFQGLKKDKQNSHKQRHPLITLSKTTTIAITNRM